MPKSVLLSYLARLWNVGEESNDHQSSRLCADKKHHSSSNSKVRFNQKLRKFVQSKAVNPSENVFCGIRVLDTMPLYDILNEFQKGLSHIAAVIQLPSQTMKHLTTKRSSEGKHEIYTNEDTTFSPSS